MKKITLTLMMLFIATSFSFSQDIITKKSGEDIQAKILEVTPNEVKFKKFNDLEGPIFSIFKSEILMIRYKNGTKDIFNEYKSAVSSDMATKGKQDANTNYRAENSGAGWTAAATILTSPVLGVIPAALCSSVKPADENLNYKDSELMKNEDYNKAYVEQAHRIKKKTIWTNFGFGSGAWILILLVL